MATDLPDAECAMCAPHTCIGTTVHALYASIRTSTAPRSLAPLLGCSPAQLRALGDWGLLGTLNRLTYRELLNVARATGFAPDTLINPHHDDNEPADSATSATRRAQLIALVLHHHPTGCHPDDVARDLNWPLTTVYDTIQAILEHQPEGQRLRITGNGHLVLRPDDTCPTIATATHPPINPDFRLTPELATTLWHLCDHSNTAPIPDHHTTALHAAGLLNTDGPQFNPTIDVTHSLQFY